MSSNRLSLNEPPPSYESIGIDQRTPGLSPSNRANASSTQVNLTPRAPSLLPLLTIPTKKYPLSSGFPYNSSIFRLGVSPDTWTQFSDEIVKATKLSLTQQSLAWTSGIGVGLVSVAAVPPFGAAAGVFAGKAVYDKSILSKVKQGLGGGKLGEVLDRWNELCWREKGVVVRLDVKQGKPNNNQDNGGHAKDAQKKKDKKKDQRQGYGQFELVFESATAIPSRIDTTVTDTSTRSPTEITGTHTNTVPIQLDDSTFAELQPTIHHPRLANEKAAAAATVRSSGTSTHPPESPHSPVSETGDIVSPGGVAQDRQISPVTERVERQPYDHLQNFTNASLAPAPLFSE